MEGDVSITTEIATELQHRGQQQAMLVMWTVTWNSSDYPRKAVARPQYVGATVQMLNAVLVADSLNELRNLLPDGLIQMERFPGDDPVIIEVWM
jgi:hypothetical protein